MATSPVQGIPPEGAGRQVDPALLVRLLETSSVAIVIHDEQGGIVDCSAGAARLLGLDRQAMLGVHAADPCWEAVDARGTAIPAEGMPALRAIRTGQSERGAILGVRSAEGRRRWLLVDTDVFSDAQGRRHAMASFMDVTDRLRLEAWQNLTLRLFDGLGQRARLRDLLLQLVSYVESQLAGARCSVQLLSNDGGTLVASYSPSLPGAYLDALAGIQVSPTTGSCGAAAALGRTVVVADVMAHPNWAPYRELAVRFGFRACWSEPVLNEAQRAVGTFAVYYDAVREPEAHDLELLRQSASLASIVIERSLAHEDLRLAAALFEQGGESVIVTDAAHRILRVNHAFERLTGYAAAEVLGETPSLMHAVRPGFGEGPGVEAGLASEGRWKGELLLRHKSGDVLPVWLSIVALRDAAGEVSHYLRSAIDLRETKAQAERIRELAFFDPLTRLPNRALVADRLKQAIGSAERRHQTLAVLFVDLNRFKEVNDTLGHDAGDEILVTLAKRFAHVVRRDETLGRLGGDEFIVIADAANEDDAARCAERLIEALAEPIVVQEQPFVLGASIGIAMYPADGTTPEALMKHADIAMYRAKAAGGGFRLYRPEMSSGLGERVALARDLRHALRTGEGLALHFQPQFDLASGALRGAEALLRWHHPTLGPISPGLFIPLAEERSMMVEVGEWVLGAACRQLASWKAEGRALPGRLAINISAHQLDVPDALPRTLRVLAAHGIAPSDIELELTESALMRNIDHALKAMHGFRDAGMALAIDDFGTGYSSLAYLKRFPVERLKVDQSFVRDMLVDRNDFAIVGSIVAMAQPLRLATVAEGVEEPAQVEALRDLGCQQAQGYLFGRPVPAEVFAQRWLAPLPVP